MLLRFPPLQLELLAHLPRTLSTLQLGAWAEWALLASASDYEVVTAEGTSTGGAPHSGVGGSSGGAGAPPAAFTTKLDEWVFCDGEHWVTPVWGVTRLLLEMGDSAVITHTMELLAGECPACRYRV